MYLTEKFQLLCFHYYASSSVAPSSTAAVQQSPWQLEITLSCWIQSRLTCRASQGKWTPLHFAAWNGQTLALETLIAAGADADAKDVSRLTVCINFKFGIHGCWFSVVFHLYLMLCLDWHVAMDGDLDGSMLLLVLCWHDRR